MFNSIEDDLNEIKDLIDRAADKLGYIESTMSDRAENATDMKRTMHYAGAAAAAKFRKAKVREMASSIYDLHSATKEPDNDDRW